MQKNITNLINHVVYVLDESASMSGNQESVVKVFDGQVKKLAKRSQESDQETRVSVYKFGNNMECLLYEKDVLRLPSLKGLYTPSGGTALMDATMASIEELEQIPQQRGDHSFLFYIMTDGEENQSRKVTEHMLNKKIQQLADNWTLACLVPNAHGIAEAKRYGFPAGNIAMWDPNKIETAEHQIDITTQAFFKNRAVGIRGTRQLFQVDVNLTKNAVVSNLDALPKSGYVIVQSSKDVVIKEAAIKAVGSYVIGNAYYELVKTEELQSYKNICIRDRIADKVYVGDAARSMLGLPKTTIKVKSGNFKQWQVFVQSTSVNRKIPAHTDLLVLD